MGPYYRAKLREKRAGQHARNYLAQFLPHAYGLKYGGYDQDGRHYAPQGTYLDGQDGYGPTWVVYVQRKIL